MIETIKGLNHWVERAINIGLNNTEIDALILQSSEALQVEVQRREQMWKLEQDAQTRVTMEANTLEFSVAFVIDTMECHETYRRIQLKNGNYLEVYSNPDLGMIREFDLNVIVACFLLGRHTQWREYCATNYQIATILGLSRSGRTYDEIDRSFDRIGSSYIKTNNWWSVEKKTRISIAAFNFFQKYEYDEKTGMRRIKFSEWIEDSMEARYLKQLDFTKIRSLRGAAKIIYLNLVKLIGQKQRFEVSEELVLRWLGKWDNYQNMVPKRRNFYIQRSIDPKFGQAVEAFGYEHAKKDHTWQIMRRQAPQEAAN